MEEITLILIGVTFLFYFLWFFKRTTRIFDIGGSIIGVCAVCSILSEPWNEYTLFILVPVVYCLFMLMVGAICEND